jgi:hypothetical protein
VKLIERHWFRADSLADPCEFLECGKPREAHVEACGEWTDPKHVYKPWGGCCGRCGRHWRHSTHWVVSRKNRSMWVWPWVGSKLLLLKDWPFRSPRCLHFSHRLKLPCFRPLSSCSGLCEVHYDDCVDGCP